MFDAASVTPLVASTQRRAPARARGDATPGAYTERTQATGAAREVDLHGLTVDAALDCVERALNAALLADLPELRLVHGKSGGRIRGALHQQLRAMPSVRGFRLDPRNEGVTIVVL